MLPLILKDDFFLKGGYILFKTWYNISGLI